MKINKNLINIKDFNVYSDNEQIIGLWDGKTLYRKTITKNNTTPNTNSYMLPSPTGLDKVFNLDIMQYAEGSYIHDYFWNSTDYLRVFYGNGAIQVRTSKNGDYNHYVTIEYTKS